MRRSSKFLPLKLPATCVLVFGLIVSIALFLWVYRYQQRIEAAHFERRAQVQSVTVKQGISNAIEALKVVNQLFATNGSVSPEQFHTFTQPLRARYPYIVAFAFQRVVLKNERAAYEARMGTSYPGFTIAELIDGKRVAAAVKDRYHVIEYREPMIRHESAFGLDASSMPLKYASQRAEDTGLPMASDLFRIFMDRGEHLGLRILMAVYKGGAVPADVAARRLAVTGYTVAVLRAGQFFEDIFGSVDHAGLDIRIYATATAGQDNLVYGPDGAVIAKPQRGRPAWLFGTWPQPFSQNFDIAGTAWKMVVSAQPSPFFAKHAATHAAALLALLMGLLTTFMATVYLQSLALRAQRIQQLVARRTGELSRVNSLLIEDIKAREQAEQALIVSEDRARELAELSTDWFWEQDEHFRYTSYSCGAMGKGGPPSPIMLGATRWEFSVDPDASDWPAHRALLEAHQPYKNFEFKTLIDGMPIQWFSSSGKPRFDADGNFKGYRGTGRNISKRKQAEEELLHSRSKLRKLAFHQESVKEDERKRIARDIHDDLGQNLMALRIDVSMMTARPDSASVTKERVDAALRQIDATIKAVRVIINDLRPAVLDLGLHAAVEWQAKQFEQRSGISCELLIDHDEFALDEKRATVLFRIVQESLSNIMRHAQASHVQIELQQTDGRLSMKIADDGIGLAPDWRKEANGFGLIGIEERIHMIGGSFSAISDPGQGLEIIVSIPI